MTHFWRRMWRHFLFCQLSTKLHTETATFCCQCFINIGLIIVKRVVLALKGRTVFNTVHELSWSLWMNGSFYDFSWNLSIFLHLSPKWPRQSMLIFYPLLLSRYYNSNSYSNSQYYSQARMLNDAGFLSEDWNLMGLITKALDIYSRLNQEEHDQ